MNKAITIFAIDRAEHQLNEAIAKYKKIMNVEVNCYLLISEEFQNSPVHYGNECPDLFKQITVDFNDSKSLKQKVDQLSKDTLIVVHCRMEEAIKDYKLLIPMLANSPFNPTVSSLEVTTQKSLMRGAMQSTYPEIGPGFMRIHSDEELPESSAFDLNFPVIVKPNGLHSSFLVKKCTNFIELQQYLSDAFSLIEQVYTREYGTGKPSLVIEEFIDGSMYSIDAYVDEDGKLLPLPPARAITSSEVNKDGFYGYESYLPSELSENETQKANECLAKCVEAVGLKNSSCHVELFNTVNGWKIVEIAPRIGGYRHDMYYQAYGINHFLNDLLIHTGEKPILTPRKYRYSRCASIYPDQEGTIKKIYGSIEASQIESVIQFGVYVKEGEKAVFSSNGGKMVADATFGNDDLDKLLSDIKKFRETFIVQVL
jgi:biotin carboxylase